MNTSKCSECKWFEEYKTKNTPYHIDGICKNKRHTGNRTWYVYSNASMCFDGQLPHRQCSCGGEPVFQIDWSRQAKNDMNDCYVKCERCHRRTKSFTMPWLAWRAWDNKEVDDEQMSIFDMMEVKDEDKRNSASISSGN